MRLIEKEQFREIVPVAVKYSFTGWNILFCPSSDTSVTIIRFVVTDSVYKTVFVITERVQPAHVVKEKYKERYCDHPWSCGFSSLDPGLFVRRFRNVQI